LQEIQNALRLPFPLDNFELHVMRFAVFILNGGYRAFIGISDCFGRINCLSRNLDRNVSVILELDRKYF
jgi:hypothetical protein